MKTFKSNKMKQLKSVHNWLWHHVHHHYQHPPAYDSSCGIRHHNHHPRYAASRRQLCRGVGQWKCCRHPAWRILGHQQGDLPCSISLVVWYCWNRWNQVKICKSLYSIYGSNVVSDTGFTEMIACFMTLLVIGIVIVRVRMAAPRYSWLVRWHGCTQMPWRLLKVKSV